MITRAEGEQLAQAIHALRHDWPTAQLLTLIGELQAYSYRDLACALTWIALDRDFENKWVSKTPYRIKEDGPWWTGTPEKPQPDPKAERERQERLQEIHERNQRIRNCDYCDKNGRNEHGHMCRHDLSPEERTLKAKQHADQARANIRSPKCQDSTTNPTATSADANAANATKSETTK